MTDIPALTRLIEPELKSLGYDLVRVAFIGGSSDPTLQVMAERPDTRQLDLSDCERISRRLSDLLDTADPVEGSYRLEVSSPGIDRPLTRAKDYSDWKGHQARLKLHATGQGPKQVTGRIEGISGDVVFLTTPAGAREIPLQSISSAKLVLTDELIKATAPLSTEGADLIEETEG
ncbi:MAG: ribosome maturation protein RimP [Alphaproteobacteria bacterium]